MVVLICKVPTWPSEEYKMFSLQRNVGTRIVYCFKPRMYVASKYISRLVDKASANTMNMNIYVKYPKVNVYSNLNSKQWSLDFPNRAKQIKTAENWWFVFFHKPRKCRAKSCQTSNRTSNRARSSTWAQTHTASSITVQLTEKDTSTNRSNFRNGQTLIYALDSPWAMVHHTLESWEIPSFPFFATQPPFNQPFFAKIELPYSGSGCWVQKIKVLWRNQSGWTRPVENMLPGKNPGF